MAYRNRVFVSFDGDKDIRYYRLMKAWRQNDNTAFNFHDAHDLFYARDTSLESSIKSRLGQRLASAKVFILLIGTSTRYLFKFVRWEIEQALRLKLPIIAVNLNKTRHFDSAFCPPLLSNELVMHVSFNSRINQQALETWPLKHRSLAATGARGPYYYEDTTYARFGL